MSLLIDQVAAYLEAQGEGVVGTSIFKVHRPSSPLACVSLHATGGYPPDTYTERERPTVMVFARAAIQAPPSPEPRPGRGPLGADRGGECEPGLCRTGGDAGGHRPPRLPEPGLRPATAILVITLRRNESWQPLQM